MLISPKKRSPINALQAKTQLTLAALQSRIIGNYAVPCTDFVAYKPLSATVSVCLENACALFIKQKDFLALVKRNIRVIRSYVDFVRLTVISYNYCASWFNVEELCFYVE